MNIYQPYFYVIQEVKTGMYYAGAKWAKDANPEKFMTPKGYHTSSKRIKLLIESNGLDSFIVRRIRTFKTAEEVYQYESRFLRKANAKDNEKFLNYHNNDGLYAKGLKEFRERAIATSLKRYGVEFSSQSEEKKADSRQTCLDKYGVEHVFQSDEFRENAKNSLMERYGVDNARKSEIVDQQIRNTCMERYGVEHVFQAEEFIENTKQVMIDRFGVDHYSKSEEFKTQYKETSNERFGFDNPMQSEEVKAKAVATNLERYGATSFFNLAMQEPV